LFLYETRQLAHVYIYFTDTTTGEVRICVHTRSVHNCARRFSFCSENKEIGEGLNPFAGMEERLDLNDLQLIISLITATLLELM
jgi:hypothetical protein